jgi:hypothetical protein
MPLVSLEASNILATDLSPLAAPLERLTLKGTRIADIAPLRSMPLKNLTLDYDPSRHADTLRAIPTLKTLNGKPAVDVLGGRK